MASCNLICNWFADLMSPRGLLARIKTKPMRETGNNAATARTGQFLAAVLITLVGSTLWASDGGSLLGTVTDPNGAAVPGAKVTATETATAVKQTITTDRQGFYSFQSLSVGRYDVEVDASGFKPLRRTGVVIDVNSKVVVDASLVIGERTETVTVSESAVHVETADTQMGEVITGKQMTAVPLNGRSYTDLLALQSGVAPVTSLTSDTTQGRGCQRVFSLRRFESRHHLDQRSAGICQQLCAEWKRRRRRRQHGHGDHSQPGFHRRIPDSHEQLRRGIRRVQRRPDRAW